MAQPMREVTLITASKQRFCPHHDELLLHQELQQSALQAGSSKGQDKWPFNKHSRHTGAVLCSCT